MAEQRQIELPEELKGKKFRIRKLTPRECFRLMGVDDKDIDKIQSSGVSNSAQINSLVTASSLTYYFICSERCSLIPKSLTLMGNPRN